MAFVRNELMQNLEVVAPTIHHPSNAARIQNRQGATGILSTEPRGAVQIAVTANHDGAQRIRSILVVSIRVQSTERMQRRELTGGSDFEDRAVAVRTAKGGHAIENIVEATRQRHPWSGPILVVSVRIECAEDMQYGIVMQF